MPSAFNDDVQFGLQVSRPTNLYALKALQLREKVFQWIARRTFFWSGYARIHRLPILVSKYFEVSMDMAPNSSQIHLFDSFCFHHLPSFCHETGRKHLRNSDSRKQPTVLISRVLGLLGPPSSHLCRSGTTMHELFGRRSLCVELTCFNSVP